MKTLEIYRCPICGHQVEVTAAGSSGKPPVCCGLPMKLQQEQSADPVLNYHVPVIETTVDGIRVRVGQPKDHPMTPEHFIEWIEVINGSFTMRFLLRPGDQPQAFFAISYSPNLIVRASCNLHGVWKNKERFCIMKKYVCNVCGYVYDPAVGDPESGIKPGTKFEDIPDSWVCPLCGVTKADFSPVAD